MRTGIVLALMQLPGIGRKSVQKLFSLTENMDADPETVRLVLARAGAGTKAFRKYTEDEILRAAADAQRIAALCEQKRISVIDFLSDAYPKRLRRTDDPPALLFCRGSVDLLQAEKSAAAAGTRSPSPAGREAAECIGRALALRGYAVVSGLAAGCDTASHRGCLAGGGKTIAVLPSAIDRVYPAANGKLAEEIIARGGCLVSEYPPGTELFRNHFVERDRMISGLGDGLIAVETGPEGGTMHAVRACVAAKHALGTCVLPDGASGNERLISQYGAFALRENADLDAFEQAMEQVRRELLSNPAGGQGRWEQMTLCL